MEGEGGMVVNHAAGQNLSKMEGSVQTGSSSLSVSQRQAS